MIELQSTINRSSLSMLFYRKLFRDKPLSRWRHNNYLKSWKQIIFAEVVKCQWGVDTTDNRATLIRFMNHHHFELCNLNFANLHWVIRSIQDWTCRNGTSTHELEFRTRHGKVLNPGIYSEYKVDAGFPWNRRLNLSSFIFIRSLSVVAFRDSVTITLLSV